MAYINTAEMFKTLSPTKLVKSKYASMKHNISFLTVRDLFMSKSGEDMAKNYANNLTTQDIAYDDNEAILRMSVFYDVQIDNGLTDEDIISNYVANVAEISNTGWMANIYKIKRLCNGKYLVDNNKPVGIVTGDHCIPTKIVTEVGFYTKSVAIYANCKLKNIYSKHKDFKSCLKYRTSIYAYTKDHLRAIKNSLLNTNSNLFKLESIPMYNYIEIFKY